MSQKLQLAFNDYHLVLFSAMPPTIGLFNGSIYIHTNVMSCHQMDHVA